MNWYEEARKHFNTVTGKDYTSFAEAAAAFFAGGGESGMTKATTQADSTASDVAGLKTDFNALLAKLKSAGLMAS